MITWARPRAKANLKVFITAARQRGEALDHVLLHGHPGLGKTTLAHILASEMGVGITATSGPVLERAGDLAAILTNLEERDVLFVDEIHRLNHVVEEVLYPAMEDFHLDLVIGAGPSARTVKLDLPPFTLVGGHHQGGPLDPAPARPFRGAGAGGLLQGGRADPDRDPLGAHPGPGHGPEGAAEIARRSRATPRWPTVC